MNVDQSLSAATAIQRVTNRLALEFMLKGARIGGWAHGGNLNRSLTYFAIQDANVEHLSRDPKLAWTYADDYPPDNVRRPISVHALAQTLNFSPETVRRHVLALIEEGACDRIEGQGVIIPKRHLMTPKIQGQRMAIIAAFNQLISDLNAIGFDFAAAPPRNSSISEAVRNRNTAPVLLITRLINAYILRVLMDGIRVLGDFPTNVIYGMIMAINTRHITFDPKLTWRFAGADQTPPDDFRTPVSIRQLAAELGMALQHCPAAGAEDGGARPVSAPGKRIHHPKRLHDQA
jgi:DNA-binding transcriptional regulator YhcF (GntR family)